LSYLFVIGTSVSDSLNCILKTLKAFLLFWHFVDSQKNTYNALWNVWSEFCGAYNWNKKVSDYLQKEHSKL
jgi:hypothetical protein